jgi:hypothetical protein
MEKYNAAEAGLLGNSDKTLLHASHRSRSRGRHSDVTRLHYFFPSFNMLIISLCGCVCVCMCLCQWCLDVCVCVCVCFNPHACICLNLCVGVCVYVSVCLTD